MAKDVLGYVMIYVLDKARYVTPNNVKFHYTAAIAALNSFIKNLHILLVISFIRSYLLCVDHPYVFITYPMEKFIGILYIISIIIMLILTSC